MIGILLSFQLLSSAPDSVLQINTFAKQLLQEHPAAIQADLMQRYVSYELVRARSFTEPSLDFGYDRKRYSGRNYWSIASGNLEIPTITGISLYGHFDQVSGDYLNPERNSPSSGLYSAGFKLPLAQGLVFNEQRFQIRQSRLIYNQARFQRIQDINGLLYQGLEAYWEWVLAYNDLLVSQQAFEITQGQFEQIKSSALLGELPIIDTLESHIQLQNREIALNDSRVQWIKSSQNLLNYIWNDSLKVLLETERIFAPVFEENPQIPVLAQDSISRALLAQMEHPELQILTQEAGILKEERRYKTSKLLPKIDLKYNFLFDENNASAAFNNFGNDYYKAGLTFKMPLLLRNERAGFQQIKIKQNMLQLKTAEKTRKLNTQLQSAFQEYQIQTGNLQLSRAVAQDYYRLFLAEQVRFFNGESSVFLINQRINAYFQARGKLNQVEAKWRINLIKYYYYQGNLQEKMMLIIN